MKTVWDLKQLYKSDTDPKIEKDIKAIENTLITFEKKYRNKTDYLKDEKKLLDALKDYEILEEKLSYMRPSRYFYLKHDLDAQNKVVQAKMNVITERLTKAGNHILFFNLQIGKIDTKLQQKFLKSSALKKYHYYLKIQFESGKYTLSEPEEKILSLKRMPAHGLWVQAGQKMITKQVIKWKGKDLPLAEAQNILSSLNTPNRRKLAALISDSLYEISDVVESELNAVIINKKINDELRGYEKPYSATIKSYQNDEKSIETLIKTVTDHFHISHRFFKLKKKILGLSQFQYEDAIARVGKIDKKISFEKGYSIVKSAFNSLDSKYVKIYENFFKNGQVDVYPQKGKRGGAYCMSSENAPTFILLNHVPNMNSVMTLAHEMGHAFHSELSRNQPLFYQDYTTSIAEVASTFFEAVVFDHVFEMLDEKEKRIALHDKIQDDIGTIFRQTAAFNYELDLHTQIRERGSLSKEEMAALLNKHFKSYLGPVFDLREKDGYRYVSWPHFRYFFYVYAYAYGQIISKALYARYKEDKSYLKEIEKFLSAGGSKSPEDIFKEIGIDTSKPEFFIHGLKSVEEDIKKLEKLYNT
jgi:oligoendopeptidase F